MIDLKAIPENWQLAKFGEVCRFSQGIQVDISKQAFEKVNGYVRFLRIVDFTKEDEPPRYIEHPGEKYFLKSDEIAMVRYGTVGFVCTGKEGVIANNLFKVIPNETLNSKYLINFLNSHEFRSKLKTKGATMQALSFGMINPIPIPIPPLEVQNQIVSKIEVLFSELDKGIEELKTAQQQLKVYRQAVLKWAFEGKLTNEDVKDGELPEGWKQVLLGDVLDFVGSGVTPKGGQEVYQASGVMFIRSQNVYPNKLDLDDVAFISDEIDERMKRTRVMPEDVLLNITGASIGRCAYVPKQFQRANVNQHVCILRTDKRALYPIYLSTYLNSSRAQSAIMSIQGGATRQGLNFQQIRGLMIPICSIEEQQQIVQEIESRLSVCDKIEETITDSLKQAEALRQSILKKAFEGRLIHKPLNG